MKNPILLRFLLKLEVNEKPPKVFTVILNAMVEGFDVGLLQKALYFFTKLPASFSGNDLYFTYLLFNCFFKNVFQRLINSSAIIINIV